MFQRNHTSMKLYIWFLVLSQIISMIVCWRNYYFEHYPPSCFSKHGVLEIESVSVIRRQGRNDVLKAGKIISMNYAKMITIFMRIHHYQTHLDLIYKVRTSTAILIFRKFWVGNYLLRYLTTEISSFQNVMLRRWTMSTVLRLVYRVRSVRGPGILTGFSWFFSAPPIKCQDNTLS
jgi:hypothetical protein